LHILETDRLVLRDLTLEDAPFVLELLNSKGFLENIGDRGLRSVEDAERYIRDVFMALYARHGFGLWAVVLKETGELTGICGLVKRDGLDHPDVGYAFLERFFGRGYAVESAAATLAYARDTLGLRTILGITVPENAGSVRVLERIGLERRGMITLPKIDRPNLLFATPDA